MRKLLLLVFTLTTLCLKAQDSANKLQPFYYLVGSYDVKIFAPDESGDWKPDGTGESTYSLLFDSTYIDESLVMNMSNATMTMRNTLGVDGRTKEFRMIALDKEYSTMDVYDGKAEGEILVLSNLDSDEGFETQNAGKINFRLTVSPSENCHHEMLVEYTNDGGQSWKKFSRQEYYLKS